VQAPSMEESSVQVHFEMLVLGIAFQRTANQSRRNLSHDELGREGRIDLTPETFGSAMKTP